MVDFNSAMDHQRCSAITRTSCAEQPEQDRVLSAKCMRNFLRLREHAAVFERHNRQRFKLSNANTLLLQQSNGLTMLLINSIDTYKSGNEGSYYYFPFHLLSPVPFWQLHRYQISHFQAL